MSKASEAKIRHFDLTIPKKGNDWWTVIDILKSVCALSKSFIQEETGLTGYEHFQGRVSFKKQFRHGEWKKYIQSLGIFGVRGSPTVTGNIDNFDYVSKDFTRGEQSGFLKDLNKPYLTWQLDFFRKNCEGNLFGYQQLVLDRCNEKEMRKIVLFYDCVGNCGKSLFLEYLEFKGLGFEVPPFRCMEDIMQFVFSFKEHANYFFDMPRGMKGSKLYDFISGIESLKNGVVYDKRNMGKKRRQGRPQVFLFSNDLPPLDALSADRWDIFTINGNKDAIPFCVNDTVSPPNNFDVRHQNNLSDLDFGL